MTKKDRDRLREMQRELRWMAENYADSFTRTDILNCAVAIRYALRGDGFNIRIPRYNLSRNPTYYSHTSD